MDIIRSDIYESWFVLYIPIIHPYRFRQNVLLQNESTANNAMMNKF